MLKIFTSFSLIGVFSCLAYFCLNGLNHTEEPKIQASYLKPEINTQVKVYRVPVIKVNGEIIGEKDANQIAHQKGVGFIEGNRGNK